MRFIVGLNFTFILCLLICCLSILIQFELFFVLVVLVDLTIVTCFDRFNICIYNSFIDLNIIHIHIVILVRCIRVFVAILSGRLFNTVRLNVLSISFICPV